MLIVVFRLRMEYSIAESPKYPPSQNGGKGKPPPISARKLAATLWVMNEIPSPHMKEDALEERRLLKKEMRGNDRSTRSVQSGSLPPHLSDPSHSPYSEIETRFRGMTPTGSVLGTKNRLKDLSNGLTTSKELLKVLNRIWGLEEQHSSSMFLVSALRVEIDCARMQVEQLIQEQRSDRGEINYLMKCFAKEKAAWKTKEQERIQAAIDSVVGDLDIERKLKRRAESLNKKLGKELAETKASLSKVIKEFESERRVREVMEEACEALARNIGEDKAEVEELKRESAKVREEVEKEREMLQLADVLREERVQMKLSEAKFQFEEKNAVVDKLRNEPWTAMDKLAKRLNKDADSAIIRSTILYDINDGLAAANVCFAITVLLDALAVKIYGLVYVRPFD
ncbi:hypothetical protein NE237_016426 [Protea cynaroides]|uniref:Uncharacterized protein n=1 Tax=Protea cynaroides TaxID=273540 RepID=A0A9Q0K6C4_9MAGN|nr:hypothetical protein NE237_016426 [Protea cynaroides]